jgi:hypothetical protein
MAHAAGVNSPSTTSPASANACPCWPTSNPAANTSWPTSSHRRHRAADEDAARCGPAARRLHDRHRPHHGENLEKLVKPYPEGQDDHPPASTTRSKRTATSSSSRQPRRPAAPSPKSPARKAEIQGQGPRLRLRGDRAESAILDGTNQKRATSSSSATKAPRAAPACAKCWPHQRHHGPRPRQGRGPHHRRPLLRRQPRLRRRPHHPEAPSAARSPSSRTANPAIPVASSPNTPTPSPVRPAALASG